MKKLAVSAITFWEVAMLNKKGRITLTEDPNIWRQQVFDLGIKEIEVTGEIGIKATELEDINKDPADRIVVATTLIHSRKLITADNDILQWAGFLDRHDARK